ncbi:MAG: SH3 domain-containing protein [Gammaproteobacteria bacterium]|nr:SH3 domain-containing protein [Gammaproteobacteria bacterium]
MHYRPAIILSLFFAIAMWGTASDAQESITIGAEFVEMRKGPGEAYPIFYVVEKGETVTLIRQQNEWMLVRLNDDVQGWLQVEDVLSAVYRRPVNLLNAPLGQKKIIAGFGWLDGSGVYGIGAGYRFSSRVGFGVHVARIISGMSVSNVLQPRIDIQMFEYARFNPLIVAGFGVMDNVPERSVVGARAARAQIASYAVGVRYYSSSALFFNVLVGGSTIQSKTPSQHFGVRIEWENAF